MDHGLYPLYLSMRAKERTLDVLANNIANAGTPGFKADRMYYWSIQAQAQAQLQAQDAPANSPNSQSMDTSSNANTMIENTLAQLHSRSIDIKEGSFTDHSSGILRETGQPLDIALNGEGLFVVQTARGTRYTRSGNLTRNTDGQLATNQGDLILGEKGPITLPKDFSINERGEIFSEGQLVDRLKLVRFDAPDQALTKEGSGLFSATNPAKFPPQSANVKVVQGALEMSNIDPVLEMANMIKNSREFDSMQKSFTMLMSELGRKVANEIGRL